MMETVSARLGISRQRRDRKAAARLASAEKKLLQAVSSLRRLYHWVKRNRAAFEVAKTDLQPS